VEIGALIFPGKTRVTQKADNHIMFLACGCPYLPVQLLLGLTAMYVLEPLFTKVYMQNLLSGAEKVLAVLRWVDAPLATCVCMCGCVLM